jgi:hypothetical protein
MAVRGDRRDHGHSEQPSDGQDDVEHRLTVTRFVQFVQTRNLRPDFLRRDERELEHTPRAAVLIHAGDKIAAVMAGAREQLRRRIAALIGAISAVNVSLALDALRGNQRVSRRSAAVMGEIVVGLGFPIVVQLILLGAFLAH